MSDRAPDQRSTRSTNSGFTLLEVLVTVVILSIGLTAVLRAYAAYVSALERAGDVLISQMIIDETLENIRFSMHSRTGLRPRKTTTSRMENGVMYTVKTSIGPAQRADHDAFYDVVVIVERYNSSESHRVHTLVRQPPGGKP